MEKGPCFRCQRPGHLAKNCTQPVKIQKNSVYHESEIKEDEFLFTERSANIEKEKLYRKEFVDIYVDGIKIPKALVDGEAKISCIHPRFIDWSRVNVQGKISVLGLQGKANIIDVVVQPKIEDVVNLLKEIKNCSVLSKEDVLDTSNAIGLTLR
ncbi:hypothetical protein HELRODRAFT_169181 [Helobdella robusta]|uniref:CCHC-type domain-containing protein n=1 Tax=Helobdella robusta TaxID=6412 RepID=T1F1J3_HELRO|nr:hypothetical protein HELRODRAFT_169181 [Helobdella robusta]ESO08366.1 hypothetical protein HELRODRAFT_169181 [Helobdella robusta]